MFEISKTPTHRVFDLERGLEVGQGPGAHGRHRNFIHEINLPDRPLGGQYAWRETLVELDSGQEGIFPKNISRVVTYKVSGGWPTNNELQITGYSRQESLEIVREVLLLRHQFFEPKLTRNVRYLVEFWPQAEVWLKGTKL